MQMFCRNDDTYTQMQILMLKQQNELQNHFHFQNYSNYNILNFYCNMRRHRRLNFSIRNHFFFHQKHKHA